MTITESLRGALRRMSGSVSNVAVEEKRRTVALPSIFNTYGPRADVLPKATPTNLRKFAETPVARRAINAIKDPIAGMRWRVQPKRGRSLDELPMGAERIALLTANFEAPNPDDSFRSLIEQVLEDVIVGGFGAIELVRTDDALQPITLFPVDGASIRMKTDWDGSPSSPRYVQVTGRFGADGMVTLNDEDLSYIRLNTRTHTPFGLGRLEVAFETINSFLTAHRFASRLASNSVVQYALWLQNMNPTHHDRLIRWWQDEVEGTGRVPILSVESKPEVLRFGGGTDADLRMGWQEFLLRVIADAFDLPPQMLGVTGDVNRSTAAEQNNNAFRQAIVPTARLIAEHITRDAISKSLGWHDLEFVFSDLEMTSPLEDAQIQEILLRNQVLTVSEVRIMRGLSPL